MTTIIAIWNAGGKGKSSTILNLAKLLISTYPRHSVVFCSKNASALTIDFSLILEIGGKIIALESQGDPNTDLEKRLDKIAITYKPDLVICSTRTRGETVQAVHRISQKHSFDEIWTSTYEIAHSHNIVNTAKSEHLLDLIIRLSLI